MPVVVLTFTDGSSRSVKLTPGALMHAERRYNGQMPTIEGPLFATWHRLGRPGGDFDGWADTIDDMDASDDDEGPTQPAPSAGSSPTSQ